MKKSMIGLSILAVGLLSACQKDDVTTEQGGNAKGSTYASVSVKVASPFDALLNKTRAVVGLEDGGTDAERKVTTLHYNSNIGEYKFFDLNNTTPKLVQDASKNLYYLEEGFKTEPGKRVFGVILNSDKDSFNHGFSADALAFVPTSISGPSLKTEIKKLTNGTKGFVMSSKRSGEVDILPNIKATDAVHGQNKDKNVFAASVERLVCKGVVKKAASVSEDIKDGTGTIDLSNLTFAGVNGATNTYLYADHAGTKPTVADFGNYVSKYEGYTSSIDKIESLDNFKDPTKAVESGLIRLGELDDTKFGSSDSYAYTAKKVNDNTTALNSDKLQAVYFMENSWSEMPTTAGSKPYGMYRLAHAKVYGKVTPKKVIKVKADDEYSYDVKGTSSDLKDGTFYMYKQGTEVFASLEAAVIYKALYYGDEGCQKVINKLKEAKAKAVEGAYTQEQKNKDIKAAEEAIVAKAHEFVYTYAGGKCGYYALWNVKKDETGVVTYADTRRNNIYVVTINSFQTIGFPWDPSDPEDPNLPKTPGDPTPGKNDPNPDKVPTHMNVDVTVAQWNVVEHDIDLSL